MTITECLHNAWTLYAGDADYPSTTESEWLAMVVYANNGISTWEKYLENAYWRELFDTLESTLPACDRFNAPSTMIFPASDLIVYDAAGNKEIFFYVDPQEAARRIKANPECRVFWLTGSGANRYINISVTPSVANDYYGRTMRLDYYKSATRYTTGDTSETTAIEMQDPEFLVEWVTQRLFSSDGDGERQTEHKDLAIGKLKTMRVANASTPFYASDPVDQPVYVGFGR